MSAVIREESLDNNPRRSGRGVGIDLLLGVPGTATGLVAIRSADTVDGQVKTQDLAQGAVTSKKVAYDSLGDIDEATLAGFPTPLESAGSRLSSFRHRR